MSAKTDGIGTLGPLALPLFQDELAPREGQTWLREVYVAIPVEQARALERWCRGAGTARWPELVRALVRAFLLAGWPPDSGPADGLEERLLRALAPPPVGRR